MRNRTLSLAAIILTLLVALATPSFSATDRWASPPSKTPILANDPHMDVGHLPAMWYEVEMHAPDASLAGATAPGLPAILFGRNRYLGWGQALATSTRRTSAASLPTASGGRRHRLWGSSSGAFAARMTRATAGKFRQ